MRASGRSISHGVSFPVGSSLTVVAGSGSECAVLWRRRPRSGRDGDARRMTRASATEDRTTKGSWCASTSTASRWASASAGSRSSTSRRATSRSPTRTGSVRSSSTARSTTSASCAPSSRRAGTASRRDADTEVIVHVYEECGDALRRAPERDVRVRALGRRRGASCCSRATGSARSRSTTREIGRLAALRLGAQGAARRIPGCPRELDLDGLSRLPRARVRARAAHDLRGRPQAAGRARLAGATARSTVERYWDARVRARDRRHRATTSRARSSARCSATAVRRRLVERRAARRVPERRDRLERGRRAHGRGRCRRSASRRSRSASTSRASTSRRTRGAWPSTSAPTTTRRSSRRRRVDLLPTVVDFLDEPFADASVLPTYLLSRFAREQSRWRSAATAATSCSPATRRSRPSASRGSSRAPAAARARWSAPLSSGCRCRRQLQPRLQAQALPPRGGGAAGAATRRGSARSRRTSRPRCSTAAGRRRWRARRACRARRASERLERSIYLYATTYLPDDILAKVDRASMACGAGGPGAVPRRRARGVPGARPAAQAAAIDTKYLLKRAVAGRLPPGIPGRPKKGFGIPIAHWFRRAARARSWTSSRPAPGARRGSSTPRGPPPCDGAPRRPPRPPQAALDALHVPALAPTVGGGSVAAGLDGALLSLPAPLRGLHEARLVDDLVCPLSGDPLRVEGDDGAEVDAGVLVCDGCGREVGDPRRGRPARAARARRPAARRGLAFGWQWQHFSEFHPEFEDQFLDWLYPIDRAFSRQAGVGRRLRHRPARILVSRFGAREVVAVDLSAAGEGTRQPRPPGERARRAGRPSAAAVSYAPSRVAAST